MGDSDMTKPTEADLLAAAVAADPGVPTISEQLANNTTPREQCNCGHAADRHDMNGYGICTVGPPCECLNYESWITPEMELENMHRIAAENAKLYNVAAVAMREVRELWSQWRNEANTIDHDDSDWISGFTDQLEAIIDRYDAAITEAIK